MRSRAKGGPSRKRRSAPAVDAATAADLGLIDNVDEVDGFFEGEVETDEGGGKVTRRKIKGYSGQILRNAVAILKDEGVRQVSGSDTEFKVQSQSSSRFYSVIVDETEPLFHCDCPFHRRLRLQGFANPICKHVKAVELWLDQQYADGEAVEVAVRLIGSMKQRSVHVKKHRLYNAIRASFPIVVPHMIRCLATTLLPEEEPRRRFPNGRKPKSATSLYANLLFAAETPTEGGREAVNRLVMSMMGLEYMCFTARLGRMGDVAVRDGLRKVLERTAKAVGRARNFACDATHFRTPYSSVTFEMREGKRVAVIRAKRCKAHIGICTDTQIIVSFYVTNPLVSEANFFDPHVDDVLRLFGCIDTWHADNTYLSKEHLYRLMSIGADPSFLEFKDDAQPNGDPVWDGALARQRARDRQGNHPRSLVETVNHVLRSRGRLVRAQCEIQRECELLARAIVYNLRRLIYLAVTTGLDIPFLDDTTRALIADIGRDKRRKKAA